MVSELKSEMENLGGKVTHTIEEFTERIRGVEEIVQNLLQK